MSWTPDGRIVYPSRIGENCDIFTVNGDGSENKQLTADAFIDQGASVSADGVISFSIQSRGELEYLADG